MSRILALETPLSIGKKVEVAGWVNSVRGHGKLIFIDLRDRSGLVQIVADANVLKDQFVLIKSLQSEDVVSVIGMVKTRGEKLANQNLKTGNIEIEAHAIKMVAEAEKLPFDLNSKETELNLTTLLDFRSLLLRNYKIGAIFKIQETITQTFRKTLKASGFTEFQAPTIVASATEGGSEVFHINYYEYDAYLAQSPQLYKQIMVSVFERVFTVAHAYRAEPSVTTRHLSEYVGLDAEMGFIKDFSEVMDIVESVIKSIFTVLKDERQEELDLFSATVPLVSAAIPRIKLKQAQEIIFQRTGRDNRQQPDLEPEDEREICRWSKEEHGSELVFVTHYPTKKRPFYTFPDPEDPEYTCSFDLLGRGVEWVTGGRRINEYPQLLENIKKWGLNPADFETYLQAFKWGMPPEGGFCLGLERITQLVLGLKNIREASLFPRDMERVDQRLAVLQPQKKKKIKVKLYEEITELLKENGITFQTFEHEAVYTSEQAAQARHTPIEEGAKALVVLADEKPALLVLSAARKVDIQKLKQELKLKDFRMANAEEVQEISGVGIGAVAPFGNLIRIPTYFDASLTQLTNVSFNAGEHTRSIQMKYKDLEKLVKPQIVDFSK